MKCLELVVTIHVQSGIAEADQQFKENQFYFKVLRDTNLIQRQRAKPNRPLQWNLSQPMQDIFRLIAGRFELSPADYLLKIYAYRTYQAEPQEAGGGLGDKVAKLKAFFGEHVKRMDAATSEAINSGLQRLERLVLRPTGQVTVPDEANVIIRLLDGLLDDLPLFIVVSTKLLHSYWKMIHALDRINDTTPHLGKVRVCGADKYLKLLWSHGCLEIGVAGDLFVIVLGFKMGKKPMM